MAHLFHPSFRFLLLRTILALLGELIEKGQTFLLGGGRGL